MTSVKNMPRQQQKAVFAKMTDDGYLKTLEGAEKQSQRRAYLLKRKDLSETYEDKIFDIYNNKKLTHRQRMDKISRVRKEAKKKLDTYQEENSGSIVGEIRSDNWQRFKSKYDIKEVPVKSKNKTIREISEAPTRDLIKKRIIVEKKKEVQAKTTIKEGLKELGAGIQAIGKSNDILGSVRKTNAANKKINQARIKLIQSKRKQRELEKRLDKK